jgi:hypothetical protein
LLISSSPPLLPTGSIAATGVKQLILDHIFSDAFASVREDRWVSHQHTV